MYYNYHIRGVKIGTSKNPAHRVRTQGYTDYEILEEHTCIYEASRRELELQAEYGYPIDTVPYWHTVTVGNPQKGGLGGGYRSQRKLTMDQARAIRSSTLNHVQCAKVYGVSRALIRGIRANRTYLE